MKELILKYGLIGGIVIAAPMFIIIPNIDAIGFDKGEAILHITMIISFLVAYLGIGAYRKKLGGYIGFRQALTTGLMISVLMSVFYAIAFGLISYVISPDYTDKYNVFALSQLKALKAPQTQIDEFVKGIQQGKLQSPFVTAAFAFFQPLTFGLFFTVSSSFILRKKEFNPSAN